MDKRYVVRLLHAGFKVEVTDIKTGFSRTVDARQLTMHQGGYDHRTSLLPGYVRQQAWALLDDYRRKSIKEMYRSEGNE